jgi:2-polyprenyl-3-methyl-5-hydroxy-6-metoxy-1,4-benzoquinol methylase
MAKKIKFESFKYRFLVAANMVHYIPRANNLPSWESFLKGLRFKYDDGSVKIFWINSNDEFFKIKLSEPIFYCRGDSPDNIKLQINNKYFGHQDPVKVNNENYFNDAVMTLAKKAGYKKVVMNHTSRLDIERDFHNDWAKKEDIESIDILKSNQVCTAPEMRHITDTLGDIKDKSLLDVGCGLGEASIYFAMLGANVTASDLSEGMLSVTSKLAKINGVSVKTHLASAEDLNLLKMDQFDIIYMGNLLHHVDISTTINKIKPHLKKNGVFVSWDPLHYNPIINIYRIFAKNLRTPDEHPLKIKDIKLFAKNFDIVETKYFWFSTLIIFILMALIQRKNPGRERFWKVVVSEGDKWRWLYNPLEKLDKFLLKVFPPFRLLCWNIVVIAKNPKI